MISSNARSPRDQCISQAGLHRIVDGITAAFVLARTSTYRVTDLGNEAEPQRDRTVCDIAVSTSGTCVILTDLSTALAAGLVGY